MNNMDISTLREVLKIELPRLLRENPEARYEIWGIMLESFPSRQEFNALHQELAAFRHETGEHFEAIEQEMRQGFQDIRHQFDRLGGRWGIRNESIFRQTISALLEESFGARVETRVIKGEQFDLIISDGVHILVEITASAGPKMQKRLERKRQLYQEETGIEPARVILATASIHSRRAEALRQAGFEVIEPEEDETLED